MTSRKRQRVNAQIEYVVGIRTAERSDHVLVEAEDALIAALKVKSANIEAAIPYVRRKN